MGILFFVRGSGSPATPSLAANPYAMWGSVIGGFQAIPGALMPQTQPGNSDSLSVWYNAMVANSPWGDRMYSVYDGTGDVTRTLSYAPVSGLGTTLVVGQNGIGWGSDGSDNPLYWLRLADIDPSSRQLVFVNISPTFGVGDQWLVDHDMEAFADMQVIYCQWGDASAIIFFGDGKVAIYVDHEDSMYGTNLRLTVQIDGPSGQGIAPFELTPGFATGYKSILY